MVFDCFAPGGADMAWMAAGAVALLCGPEGGLEEEEVTRAQAAGFGTLALGPRVLRTETAPLAALAALQARWGEFLAVAVPFCLFACVSRRRRRSTR